MVNSANSEPLLKEEDECNYESDIDTDSDEPSIVRSHKEPFIRREVPYDRYNVAYIVFYLLGMNTLIPWNFFITADDYWKYKFRPISHNGSHNINYSFEVFGNRSDLQASFTSYMCIASAVPNTLFLIINTFISTKVSLSTRMIGSQGIVLAVFILTTSFAQVNTDAYQTTFLTITLASVAAVNAASAIFGGSLLGIVGRFSPKYITATNAGQALGGIFTALTEILSLWIGASPVMSGLLYFIIGDFVLLLSLISYIFLERAVFFKYHVIVKTQNPNEPQFSINANEVTSSGEHISYSRILKKIWKYGLSVVLIFVITMSVYPSVTVLVESKGKGHGHQWNDKYFVPVVAYLLFSCGDYLGRILSGIFIWPKNKPWLVVFLSLLRILFVPAFLLCNAQPRHRLPVYIHDDAYYILLTVLFGISNGYLCNIVFMLGSAAVDLREKEIASAMLGAFLGIGISMGSPISFLMVKIL